MKKARLYTSLDFSELKPEQVQHIIRDLYDTGSNEQREMPFGPHRDRRRSDRRKVNKLVLLDTRSQYSRRQSPGRRQKDINPNNKHKVGIDYYA